MTYKCICVLEQITANDNQYREVVLLEKINGKNAGKTALKVGEYGARGFKEIILTVVRIIITVLLITITTCAIFGCVFVVYIKTNLTSKLDFSLEEYSLSQTSTVYYTNSAGNEVELIKLENTEARSWIHYADIPKDFEHAAVAIEDKRFYEHHGVDWYRTVAAFGGMFLSQSNTFGGSTITQQLIKNVTQYDDVTVTRKLTEIFKALEAERNYTKEEIMEWYLNAIYFGHRQYGIGAAARYYFDKDASDLSLAEIASIMGITNNPSIYSPFVNPEANKKRQETILLEMYKQGYITRDQYDSAVKEELKFDVGSDDDEEEDEEEIEEEDEQVHRAYYSYFIDALIEDVIHDLMDRNEVTYKEAQEDLFNSGYKIYSTINLEYQAKMDQVYEDIDNFSTGRNYLQSGMVISDPYNGHVLALCGGVGIKEDNRVLNRATQSTRPPGSSIKPLSCYAPAMDLGLITPNTRINDSPDVVLKGMPDWLPMNDNRSWRGIVTVRQGVVSSINTIAAQVLDMLTPEKSFEFLVGKLHLSSLVFERGQITDIAYAPLCLGQLSDGVIVREMAAAYSIFPNAGVYTENITYTRIEDSEGNLVYNNNPTTNVAISDVTAYWMNDILVDAVNNGTGSAAKISGYKIAGKTGTSGSTNDRWFCGYTPDFVGVVWCGYDTPSKIVWDGNPASQTWRKVAVKILEDMEPTDFFKPSSTYLAPVPGIVGGTSYWGQVNRDDDDRSTSTGNTNNDNDTGGDDDTTTETNTETSPDNSGEDTDTTTTDENSNE